MHATVLLRSGSAGGAVQFFKLKKADAENASASYFSKYLFDVLWSEVFSTTPWTVAKAVVGSNPPCRRRIDRDIR